MERDDTTAAKALADIAAGKPASLKVRFLSEDKSHRYQQLADLIAALDAKYATPRLAIDGWLNRIDAPRQLTPESRVHDLQWHDSPEIAVGTFELHMGPHR
ncbi:hypothetical protein [Dongia sedimenti]|uniref:Uncharacterized protein n=1 Tax=Dongia sedimenti TaxID=3064282 RepID=A0ABU0YKC3_9PROT|nr:hypothetical protein [Rhodospirillaceae bacterium R-7]